MNRSRVSRLAFASLSLVLFGGSFVGSALAASACKGLEQGACQGKGDCTWVEGYVRKDGVKVTAHCKGTGRSSGAASKEDKKVASKDEEKKSSSKE